MTIRFAPARNRILLPALAPAGVSDTVRGSGANDNGPIPANDEAVLVRTLRHFGQYGLCAAQHAAQNAQAASAAGDSETFDHWLSVCQMLDRRMAARIERPAASGA